MARRGVFELITGLAFQCRWGRGVAVLSDSKRRRQLRKRWSLRVVVVFGMGWLCGCTTLEPGADFPRTASHALRNPEQTQLGRQLATAAREHDGNSGFRIISMGVDGLLTRVQMIDAAERTVDAQYYIFRGDETGRLLTGALLRAADRGVRIRVLVDDGDTLAGDEQISALDAHQEVEIRIFNPFAYRGHSATRRNIEFAFNAHRLDYRMHNKLLVVDNTVALVGGRNIGNQYFQMDPDSQFADDDVFAAGPIAMQLSATFDEFWNSDFAIPAEALGRGQHTVAASVDDRARARAPTNKQFATLQTDGVDYAGLVATGEPYGGMLSGRLALIWAHAQVVCDSPDKKRVAEGALRGRLMLPPVANTARDVQHELLMVTPYFVPADEELTILTDLRQRGVRVRILTNSLESTTELAAYSGYMKYRVPLLEEGVGLYEIRAQLDSTSGSGQTALVSRYGNYALHAKLFVFDQQRIFIGSMNFDQRSKRLNTEVGLIIDSPELAAQTAQRFERMVNPRSAYQLILRTADGGGRARLVWRTQEGDEIVEYAHEPSRGWWQKLKAKLLSWLPLGKEL